MLICKLFKFTRKTILITLRIYYNLINLYCKNTIR